MCGLVCDLSFKYAPSIRELHTIADAITQIALNRFEALKALQEAMNTVVINMAESQFYASVYAGSLQMDLDSNGTMEAFRKSMRSALPEFYAAVLVFSTKAKGYFLPLGSGERPCPPHGDRHCLLTINSAKLTNYLEPFSIALGPCLQEIDGFRLGLERFASMASMERIKGRNAPRQQRFSVGSLIDSNSELRKCTGDAQIPY